MAEMTEKRKAEHSPELCEIKRARLEILPKQENLSENKTGILSSHVAAQATPQKYDAMECSTSVKKETSGEELGNDDKQDKPKQENLPENKTGILSSHVAAQATPQECDAMECSTSVKKEASGEELGNDDKQDKPKQENLPENKTGILSSHVAAQATPQECDAMECSTSVKKEASGEELGNDDSKSEKKALEPVPAMPVVRRLEPGSLAGITFNDLEEVIVQMVCEGISERCRHDTGAFRRKIEVMEKEMNKWKSRALAIEKAMRDQRFVVDSFNPNEMAAPIRITRSVGLQVSLGNVRPLAAITANRSPSKSPPNLSPRTTQIKATTSANTQGEVHPDLRVESRSEYNPYDGSYMGGNSYLPPSGVNRSVLKRHPAPLPKPPASQPDNGTGKLPPPRTMLKISVASSGVVLSWNLTLTQEHEKIAKFEIVAYQEGQKPPSMSLWKKVGLIKALQLPMACTLTQFVPGYKYHFAVRAIDEQNRVGQFSGAGTITLFKK